MDARLQALDEYYINLEYGNYKKEALKKISILSKDVRFPDVNGFSDSKNSVLGNSIYGYKIFKHINEMILLEDSDLHAAISYLKNLLYRLRKDGLFCSLNKIWIQETIKEKCLWLIDQYSQDLDLPIHTFRTKKELFTAKPLLNNIPSKNIYIKSIWTEDIIAAENLARFLNGNVLFINAHMNFYDGIVLLPYIKTFDVRLPKVCESNQDYYAIKPNLHKNAIYNLFYNGMWQKPVKGAYWLHNDIQWASATSEDINRCINSAEKGFKIWSKKSIACRLQILSNLASTLECKGKFKLADVISRWIRFSYIYEDLLDSHSGTLNMKVTKIRNPKGIIVLREKSETVLFGRLMQILTFGNSVIVICNEHFCSLAPYCDMFSTSQIPPGVINFLSSKDIKKLELDLCETNYEFYAKRFFTDNFENVHTTLTILKQIIVPLK
ncbi:hypothetical protein P5V15_007422 [Pogonomyrmex californicus]